MNLINNLDIGNKKNILIRKETVDTKRNIKANIVFLSDLHLNTNKDIKIIYEVINLLKKCIPDAILIGGDMVDSKSGLPLLKLFLAEITKIAPTFVIEGNHDNWVGANQVKEIVKKSNCVWLKECIDKTAIIPGTNIGISSPLNTLDNKGLYRIILAHYPDSFPRERLNQGELMFAGHLHGCQIVTHFKGKIMYPGAWFYKWNGLRFDQNERTLIVSRGISDTLKLRWNCPREIILCHLI